MFFISNSQLSTKTHPFFGYYSQQQSALHRRLTEQKPPLILPILNTQRIDPQAAGRYELRTMEDYQKNGKQKVVSFYGKTKQEVRDKKKAYDAGSEQGLDLKAKYTFAQFADIWFERHQEELEDATIEHYTYILKTLKEHLGKRPLTKITTPDILNKLVSSYFPLIDEYISLFQA